MPPKLTIVIPLYNEAQALPDTLPRLSHYLEKTFPGQYELLLIDDGSTDGTPAVAAGLKNDHTRVISYFPNRGKGHAVRTGMLEGKGEVLLFTDCDLAYGCEVLGEMVSHFASFPEADVLVGSRACHPEGYAGYRWYRRWASRLYRWVLRRFFGLTLSDSQSGIKGFRRPAARAIFSHCQTDRFAFDLEAILIGQRLGYNVKEMPVRVLENGKGKMHLLRDSLQMLRDLCRIRRRVRRIPPSDGKNSTRVS